jgi:hypothetical protein
MVIIHKDGRRRVLELEKGSTSTGTVDGISAGNLNPIFTTTVDNTTDPITPSLAFNLSNAPSSSVFGNFSIVSAQPQYNQATVDNQFLVRRSGALTFDSIQYSDISSLLPPSGESNTASNLGGGLSNFSGKVGVDLQFNSFNPTDFDLASNLISIDATLKNTWNNKQDAITGAALTKTDDTNITLTLGGSPSNALLNATSLTLGWSGTLSAARLNSNVVQSVTSDTNVTGSILTQNLTLGWAGQLSLSRGGTGANLSDPNANTIMGWDDIDGSVLFINIGSNLSYDHTSHTLSASAGATIAYGSSTQVPYTNTTGNGFLYSSGFTFDGNNLSISGKLNANSKQAIYVPDQTNFLGSFVVGTGGNSLSHSLINDGRYNTFVGIGAGLATTTGSNNMAQGYNALYTNTTGVSNTAVGRDAMNKNTTGSSNVAIGTSTLFSNTTGGNNMALGLQALYSSTTGSFNTAIGTQALYVLTSGSSNLASGYLAGRYIADGTTSNATANQAVYIGANTKPSASGNTNEIVIGYNSIGNGSNTVTIGNSSITDNYFTGNIRLLSGSVINWNSGDVTITHSSNQLAFAGGNYSFNGTVILPTAPSTYSTGGYDVLVRNQTSGNVEITTISGGGSGTVTSVAASVTASTALTVSGSPITTSGTLSFSWTGSNTQYVLGDGTLATKITNNTQLTNGAGYITGVSLSQDATGSGTSSIAVTVVGLRAVALPTLSVSGGFLKYTGTSTNTWIFDTNSYLTANQTITLSGDSSGSGTTSISTTVTGIRNKNIPTLATGYLYYDGTSFVWQTPAVGGGGTVTSFSSGNLSPIFTTSVATSTTTPALSFSLSNAGANTYFGNATGVSAAPSYTSAGSLTRVNDTNITLTLGGNPTTSLLQSTSLTLGWTGTLAAARLNSNVVQSVTNDTNVTGSIATQNLTLGWTGQLSLARGGTGVNLSDPNANRIWGWDDTDGAISWIVIGANLSYDHASHTLSASGGTSGLSDAYTSMTDGTNTSTSSGATTFRFRSANNLLSVVVADNDATYGDNLLMTINQANIQLTESQVTNLTTDLASKQNQLNGTGFVKASGTTISYDNSTYVPTSRTLTINGTSYDLSANRSWSVGTVTSVSATDGNGFDFTVSTSTTTPSISLTTIVPDKEVMFSTSGAVSGSTKFWYDSSGNGKLYLRFLSDQGDDALQVDGGIYAHSDLITSAGASSLFSYAEYTVNATSLTSGSGIMSGQNRMDLNFTGSTTIAATDIWSAGLNVLSLNSTASSTITVSAGSSGSRSISANNSQVQFPAIGAGITTTITNVSSFRIQAPFQATGSNWVTATNYYGLFIEDQTQQINNAAYLPNRWALYQEGASDLSFFGGSIKLNNISSYSSGSYDVLVLNQTTKLIEKTTLSTGSGTVSSGTTNSLAKYTASTTVGSSNVWDVGGNVGIRQGTPLSAASLTVKGWGTSDTTFSIYTTNNSGTLTGYLNDVGDLFWSGSALGGLFAIGSPSGDYTVPQGNMFFKLLDLTALASNKTVTFPTASSYTGQVIIIVVLNASATYHWLVSGSVVNKAGASITQLTNGTAYIFVSDGTYWCQSNN